MSPAFTKERFYLPHAIKHGTKSLRRHVDRYKWAAAQLKPTWSVMDAGCGSGYGDYILLNNCGNVFGIDRSPEAIEFAIKKMHSTGYQKKLKYEQADITKLTYYNVFDAVVCIEVLEHVSQADQIHFMRGVRNALKENGTLLITTPEKSEKMMTEYHVHELTRSEFKGLLLGSFKEVEFSDSVKYGVPASFMLAVCRGVRR